MEAPILLRLFCRMILNIFIYAGVESVGIRLLPSFHYRVPLHSLWCHPRYCQSGTAHEADERRYQLGLLSANDRMAAQAELSSKKAAWEISGLSFRQAYEDYQWAVEGLAAYEG